MSCTTNESSSKEDNDIKLHLSPKKTNFWKI